MSWEELAIDAGVDVSVVSEAKNMRRGNVAWHWIWKVQSPRFWTVFHDRIGKAKGVAGKSRSDRAREIVETVSRGLFEVVEMLDDRRPPERS